MYQDPWGANPSPYSPAHLRTSLKDCNAISQPHNVLDVLPTKSILDALIEAFISDVNHHHSIISPSHFIKHYVAWSSKTEQEQYQDSQFTTLILMMCACVTQQLPHDSAAQSCKSKSRDFHAAGQRLAADVPACSYNLTSLQWKVLSICWFQGEASFVEAWHTIGLAIQEAYELGYHPVCPSTPSSRADAQIGRQIWRVLHCWNWQLSLVLGRPMIMNDIDSEPDKEIDLKLAQPSPTLSTRLQYQLISSLAKRWHTPHRINTPSAIRAHTGLVQEYVRNLPPVYDINYTDTSDDQKWPWLVTHRYYIQAMAYLMILQPYKMYLSNPSLDPTLSDAQDMRIEAMQYSLIALKVATQWSSRALAGDRHFHILVLCLFDTAAFLGVSLAKHRMPLSDRARAAVDKAMGTLQQLGEVSQGAKTSYILLCRILKGIEWRRDALR